MPSVTTKIRFPDDVFFLFDCFTVFSGIGTTNYYTGEDIVGLQELISRPSIPVVLGWTVNNADTLLKRFTRA